MKLKEKTIGVLFVSAVCLASCVFTETYEVHCDTMKECQTTIERGWIPDWVPSDAQDIHEIHYLDTNYQIIRFTSPELSASGMVGSNCSLANTPQFEPDLLFKREWNKIYIGRESKNTIPCSDFSERFKGKYRIWEFEDHVFIMESLWLAQTKMIHSKEPHMRLQRVREVGGQINDT